MARRKITTLPPPPQKPNLVLARTEVEGKLKERIALGRDIQSSAIRSEGDLDSARTKQTKWDSYNIEYLKRCFDSDVVAEEYDRVSGWGPMYMQPSLGQQIDSFREGMENQITALESILERLELIPEAISVMHEPPITQQSKGGKSVFIVHGHDDLTKTSVARFIEKLGLEAIILHEQPNKGQTIIEKFESNAANVGFAVVLLTPDDVGAPKEAPNDVKERARQNVILELGYFCGSLGRNGVCVLYKEGVEIPSDYLGVVYTPIDSTGGWHLKLAKEMKAAGLDVDLNKAI
jgi:predicted nucleotide-binding protein